MSITAAQMNQIRADANTALAAVAAKHGLGKLQVGRGKFGADNFEFKLEGIVAGGLGPDAERYERYRHNMSLPMLGATFTHAGKVYATAGMNTTGSKIICTERASGKSYLFHTDYVKRIA